MDESSPTQNRKTRRSNVLMAASLVVMIPVIVIFLIFQKYFIEGVQIAGSLKG